MLEALRKLKVSYFSYVYKTFVYAEFHISLLAKSLEVL